MFYVMLAFRKNEKVLGVNKFKKKVQTQIINSQSRTPKCLLTYDTLIREQTQVSCVVLLVVEYRVSLPFFGTRVGCHILNDSYNRHISQSLVEKSFQEIDIVNEVSRQIDIDIAFTTMHYFQIKQQ